MKASGAKNESNVVETLATLPDFPSTVRQTITMADGDTPIRQVLSAL